MKYTIIEGLFGKNIIQREDENGTIVFIPMNEANADYQAYLATLASELSNPSTPQAGE